ncbi:glycosyltransferase family 4 protein [Pseudohalocynthiibacter aestuariivivens]|nr:glycosyltransferase [Pseudohalocynthiibacter aestuariivivens]QIE46217.1 glycosyltransferase family 4 protein [Pseudohalocynthiibacter aestuariivivens]
MSGPHILIVNVFFAPNAYGGATIVAEEVAHALRRKGCLITAISLISRAELAPYAVIKSEVNGLTSYLVNVPEGRSYAARYNNADLAESIGGLIDRLVPDLVHVHCVQDVGAGVIEVAKARGLPVVLSVHDFWWLCERQFMITPDQRYCGQAPVCLSRCRGCVEDFSAARTRDTYLKRQAALADIVTYPSQFARDLCEASGLAPGRGTVWRNGVCLPDSTYFVAQTARRATDARLAFGYLGGPAQIKGWPDIHAAFAGLERDDFTMHLVDGALDGGWWTGIDLTGLPGEWQIHPRFSQAEMDTFYAQIDVLLFPSQWKETFGLAIREALARGIRVIQTDSGGTVEHSRVVAADLIPIGAGPAPLRAQIATQLDRGIGPTAPVHVATYDDQAAELLTLIRPLLGDVSCRPEATPAARPDSWGSAA